MSLRLQEAMKAIPDQVLDAPPPQLDALPAFSLPQPLPPLRHAPADARSCTGTSANARAGVSSPGAALLSASSAGAAPIPGEQSSERWQAPLQASEVAADVGEPSAARQGERAGVLCSGEGTAETKRLRLNSSRAGDVPLAGAAQVAQGSAQLPDSGPCQNQGAQHVEDTGGGMYVTQCLEQQSEQAGKHHSCLDKSRLLVSA